MDRRAHRAVKSQTPLSLFHDSSIFSFYKNLQIVLFSGYTNLHFHQQGGCMLSHFGHVQLFATLWTVARQTPLSMGFSRQENWSGLPFLPPGDLLYPGIEPMSLTTPVLADRFFTMSATWGATAQVVVRSLGHV